MTKVVYCPHCSDINSVEPEDITGVQHMDTPDSDRVRAVLEEGGMFEKAATVEPDEWDPLFGMVTMMAYEGRLSMYELAATPYSPVKGETCPECESAPLAMVLLTVTVVNDEQLLLLQTCDECGYTPEDASEWGYSVVEQEAWTEHQYLCPDCGSCVWADVFDVDAELYDEYDYGQSWFSSTE